MTTKWWLEGNQVVGIAQEEFGTPANFRVVDGPDGVDDREMVYFNGDRVVLRPPRPTWSAYWHNDLNIWIDPFAPPVLSLSETIASVRRDILDHWNGRINALTSGYPALEIGTWTALKEEADRLIATNTVDQSPHLYREAMLRSIGVDATPEFCAELLEDDPAQAVAVAMPLAQLIGANSDAMIALLVQYKGMRGYHWERVGTFSEISEVQAYDYRSPE